jgi:hypothetical protein
MRFTTRVHQAGKTATGIVIPDDVMAALDAGKKPPVRVTINGYTYRSTVATVDGRPMVGLSAENRAASGAAGGEEVSVEIELDTEPREVALPADFAAALDAEPRARETFERLSTSMKGYHVTQLTSAKAADTRLRRLERSIAALREGKPR